MFACEHFNSGDKRMRTVALVGKSPLTRGLVTESLADEIWGAGTSYIDTRLDRLYEVHPLYQLKSGHYKAGHWDWLTTQDEVRVLMLEPSEEVPAAEKYPVPAAVALCAEMTRATGGPQKVFTSSFDFMLAAAILEDWDRVELYGFDIATKNTEYLYQVPGVAYWLGQAVGRGIEVVLPDTSPLMRSNIYAWESGGQMIARHDVDVRLRKYKAAEKTAQMTLNSLLGLSRGLSSANGSADPANKERQPVIQIQIQHAERSLFVKAGARLALEQMIDECDYSEPDYEIVNPFVEANG